MRNDYVCNHCGYEFSLLANKEDKRCPDCRDKDIFPIPVRMPDEGYQSCVFDEQHSQR
jgi:DNA-directed RNA polymerase subunit RPC12/RpoP